MAAVIASTLLMPGLVDPDESDPLVRCGFLHRGPSGVISLLPIGHRVIRRIGAIVREELTAMGTQEVLLPVLQPAALWREPLGGTATRADEFGPALLGLRGRSGEHLVLAPSHEELAAQLVSACVGGDDDLPRTIFQIQLRFRDESAAGTLFKSREFVMADAYSFSSTVATMDAEYQRQAALLCSIVRRCGLNAELARADSGAMGGTVSHEVIARTPRARTSRRRSVRGL